MKGSKREVLKRKRGVSGQIEDGTVIIIKNKKGQTSYHLHTHQILGSAVPPSQNVGGYPVVYRVCTLQAQCGVRCAAYDFPS